MGMMKTIYIFVYDQHMLVEDTRVIHVMASSSILQRFQFRNFQSYSDRNEC